MLSISLKNSEIAILNIQLLTVGSKILSIDIYLKDKKIVQMKTMFHRLTYVLCNKKCLSCPFSLGILLYPKSPIYFEPVKI